MNVGGGSTLDLVGDASTVQGAALTAGGSTSNVTLQNGSLWTMTGDSNVTSLTNGSSLIQFTPPVGDPTLLSSYKTLTAVSYIGQGGTLGLNTFLGADGSPSDRLVVSGGTATGNSLLKITNTTGAGALTTGNGILVVDSINGGTTAAGAFRGGGAVRIYVVPLQHRRQQSAGLVSALDLELRADPHLAAMPDAHATNAHATNAAHPGGPQLPG